MKKTAFILYFLILAVYNSFSQDITQNITGSVLDNVSNEPLPNANIILKYSSPPLGTVSNENGQFILKDISVGTISLRISYLGYQSLDLDNLTLKPGKEMVITARLEEMAFSGEEIVITAKTDKSKTRNTMTSVSS
ncbi:MAG: carboxypeptidase-like regulatory domain-containing protein, partial [Bacteroidota bacterium]|nr:carboxypeptidase-like regulatory domain-containing protein [Bacteroidota bacterium]